MAKKVKKDLDLSTKLQIKAILLVDISELKAMLTKYPNLKLLDMGNKLRCRIEDEDLIDRRYVIDLESSAITIELNSNISPLYFMNEMLIRFISIASFLRNQYKIDFEELIPHLIETLSAQKIDTYLKNFEIREHVHNGDLILSKRIISLVKEREQLSRECKLKSLQSFNLLQKLIAFKYNYNTSLEVIKNETGVETSDIKEALRQLPRIGYKVVYLSKDRFNVMIYGG